MDKNRGLRPSNDGKSIEIRYYDAAGNRRSKTLPKPWNATNRAEARRLKKDLEAQAKLDANRTRNLKDDNPLFQDVAQTYIDSIRSTRKDSTFKRYKTDINNRWLPYLGLIRIKDLGLIDVIHADSDFEWQSVRSRQNARSTLRQVFALAIKLKYIGENPVDGLEDITYIRKEVDPYEETEKELILSYLEEHDYQAWLFFLIAFETGIRTGENLGLKELDFKIRPGYLRIVRSMVYGKYGPPKINKARDVILSQRVIDAVDAKPSDREGLMWRNSRGTLLREAKPLNDLFLAALKHHGIRYRRPYNARHTRASIGLSAGQTPAWLANQMGHELKTFFERYAKFIGGDQDEDEMNKLNMEKMAPKS